MKNIFSLLIKNKIENCFVIFAVPRSGSNLLCGCLNSHPEIICHHELFHPENIYYSLDHRNNDYEFSTKDRNKNPIKFISSITRKRFGKKISGFKMMPDHNRDAENFILNNTDIKKIILTRENKIKTFTSLKIAEKTNCFSIIKGGEKLPSHEQAEKIYIDVEELKKYINNHDDYYKKIYNILDESNQDYFSLTYEDFTSVEANLAKENLLNFLDVESNPELIEPRHVKQNPDNLKELIENYEEIKLLLQETSLGKFLL